MTPMKFEFRKLLIGLVIVIVLAVFLLRGDSLMQLIDTMKQGSAVPLVAAILTQLCKYFAQSFAYSFCFEAVQEKMDPRSTLPLVFGTFFMNTVAPSLNLAGMTLVVDDARRRGIDPGKSSSAALLMQITIDGAFTTLMIIGFAIVVLFSGMSPLWFLPGIVVVCLVGAMIGIMVLGHRNPKFLLKILNPIERFVNKVLVRFHRKALEPWAEKVLSMFSEAAGLIVKNPSPAFKAYACSLFASCCELAAFSLVGISFGVKSSSVLLCGYVIATLFAMVSITPQGVGFVEAAVVVAFTAFGETAAAGTAIGIVYRGIVFWMPFLIGAVLIQKTKTFSSSSGSSRRSKVRQEQNTYADDAFDERNFSTHEERASRVNGRKYGSHGAHEHDVYAHRKQTTTSNYTDKDWSRSKRSSHSSNTSHKSPRHK